MKGKRSDPIFISSFIQECVQLGVENSDDIVNRARQIINQIDEEIKTIETKKSLRSKLLDVVFAFEKPIKNKTEAVKVLSFFKIKYPNICQRICHFLQDQPMTLQMLKDKCMATEDEDRNFCIKQLIEAKIIMRTGDYLMRSDKFDEYLKFISGDIV